MNASDELAGKDHSVALAHGGRIPAIGLGTWPLIGRECEKMVSDALAAGFRLIDTSHKYGNETDVGRAVRESGIPRSEIFITSKFNKENHSVDGVQRAYDESLQRLGVDYLDMFLCHWPVPAQGTFVAAWQGLVKLWSEGQVKSIGVSNFKPWHIEQIVSATGIAPDLNQIQLSVDIARHPPREFHTHHHIVTESWSPLGRGTNLDDPVVVAIAEKVGRSPAQVLLRWHVQNGIVPVPRATTAQQLTENIQVFDFSLAENDMVVLNSLDQGETAARDSDSPENGH